MKKLILFLMFIMFCLFSFAQADIALVPPPAETPGFWQLLGGYWAELVLGVMAVIKIVVRVTPSIKDDAVFGWLDKLIELIIPNIQSGKK